MATKIALPNGCSCSKLSVYPKNWKDKDSSMRKNWRLTYRFYDPAFPKPYQKVIKKMNDFKIREERQVITESLMKNELYLLKKCSYNPRTNIKTTPEPEPTPERTTNTTDLCEDTPFIEALKAAQKTVEVGDFMRSDLKYIIAGIEKSAKKLNFDESPISAVTRKNIRLLLDDSCESSHKFNKYRSGLMILFNELIELEATEVDPVTKIKKRKGFKKMRPTLTKEERRLVNAHLLKDHYYFWRFMHIFFHSGSRETEMMQIRVDDVNLEEQRFKVIVRKGKEWREEWRTIKDIILPLWKEIMADAKPGQYLFAKFLKPGEKPIKSYQIAKRWRKYVKSPAPKGLNIKADFYSLKASNLDEIAGMLSARDASNAAGHHTVKVTKDFYLPGEKEREHNRLKALGNSFVRSENDMIDISADQVLEFTGFPNQN